MSSLFFNFIRRRASWFLLLAAIFIALTGITFSKSPLFDSALFSTLITVCLVFIVYSFDDEFDSYSNSSGWKYSQYFKTITEYFAFLIATAFIAENSLSWQGFGASLFIGIIGFLYSAPIIINKKSFRLKNLYIIKNVTIGLGWGALLLLGSQQFSSVLVAYFIFTSVQVYIGSVLRDFDDIEVDRKFGVNTLPLVLGEQKALFTLRKLNLLSGLIVFLFFLSTRMTIVEFFLLLLVCLWREWVLRSFLKKNLPGLTLQILNFGTCALIFLSRILGEENGLYFKSVADSLGQ